MPDTRMDALKKAFVEIRAVDSLSAAMQRVNMPAAVDDIAQMIRWAWENQVRKKYFSFVSWTCPRDNVRE